MARAFASTIIKAPVEAVWAVVLEFNGMPAWNPGITSSEIEAGLPSDAVGCIRSFRLTSGGHVRERLLALDDSRYRFSYNFETPAFPVANYSAEMEMIPVIRGDATFAQWTAEFDEAPQHAGKYEALISGEVFAAGLRDRAKGRAAPAGATRWQGLRLAEVFASSVIGVPVEAV